MIFSPGCVSSSFGRSTSTAELFSAKRLERLAGQPVERPLGVRPGAQALVETNRLLVPGEQRPLEPAAPALQGELGEMGEQRATDAVAAVVGKNEQVLEVEAGPSQECRESVKEEGETDRLSVLLRHHCLRVRARAEETGIEQLLRQDHLVLQLLEARQLPDQAGNQRDVRPFGGADSKRHLTSPRLRAVEALRARAFGGRSRSRNTSRMAPWVSEKLAILLSTSPAARPASITSVSRSSARPPFGRTTQIAPFGSIHALRSRIPSRSVGCSAPKKTRSHGDDGLP